MDRRRWRNRRGRGKDDGAAPEQVVDTDPKGPARRVPAASRAVVVGLVLTAAAILAPVAALAQSADQFAISYGDTVSDGVPGPGAGNLEAPGSTDAYTFDATAGDVAIFDVLSGSNTNFLWRLDAPDGSAVFDGIYVDRSVELSTSGTYTVTMRGFTATSTGTYSWRLLPTPPPEQFSIGFGDTVSDGVPAPGAGNVEAPGASDVYTFDAIAGQTAVLDTLTNSATMVRWALVAPDGATVFDSLFVDQQLVLPQTGAYTLTVSGTFIASFGSYSFQLVDVPIVQEFRIDFGDTVSDGVPEPGAGKLEGPGAVDSYTFDAIAGQTARLSVLAGNPADFSWALADPTGAVLFDGFLVDRELVLPATGTYTLTLRGTFVATFGPYSFRLAEPPPNAPPVAADDEAETDHATPVTIDVLANDSDPDGDPLTIDAVSPAADGTTRIVGDRIEYAPDVGFDSVDVFTYTVGDGSGGADEATVIVTVRPAPNRAPEIEAIADQQGAEGDAVDVVVEASDPDGDPLTFAADGLPNGLDIDPSTARITGTIATGASAGSPHSVTVTATDPSGAAASATFTWTVAVPDDPEPEPPTTVRVKVWPSCVWSGVGLIKVVIYGSVDVSASQIDASTVALAGMPVATFAGWPLAGWADIDRDGYRDLVALVRNIEGAVPIGVNHVAVTASLHDGTRLAGETRLVVLPPPSRWWDR